jgi:tRNA (Thr-GGU) A37 N-methylase
MADISFHPIGIIRTPFTDRRNMPIQPSGARGVRGTVELDESLAPALKDLEGFTHIYLLYHFHMSQGFDLTVVPFMDPAERGLFATRAPRRPNQIGLDVLDGTPLLDIKPYFRDVDAVQEAVSGWAETSEGKADTVRSDDRFVTSKG